MSLSLRDREADGKNMKNTKTYPLDQFFDFSLKTQPFEFTGDQLVTRHDW